MITHLTLRAAQVCPLCLEHKPTGTLVCWPCDRMQQKMNNGRYSDHAVARMATIGVYLDAAMDAWRQGEGASS